MNRLRLAWHVVIHGGLPRREPAGEAQAPKPPLRPSPPPEPPAKPSPLPEPPLKPSPSPSAVATQLIALRDMVLLAAEQQAEPARRTPLANVARRLSDILATEHVMSFEDEGAFDPTRQRVIDTLATDDPARDYQLAASVRPGYLYAGCLFRQQDVILYRHEAERTRTGHG